MRKPTLDGYLLTGWAMWRAIYLIMDGDIHTAHEPIVQCQRCGALLTPNVVVGPAAHVDCDQALGQRTWS